MKKLRNSGVLLVAAALIFAMFSCEKTSTAMEEPVREVPEKPSTVTTVAADEPGALITYLTGNVQIENSEEKRTPEIGDTLLVGELIRTGPEGYAELQFGNLSAIRIQENSEYLLQVLVTSEERSKASGLLSSGSLIAKVRKLSGGDSFEVNVANAVCAVRGTEFLVRTSKEGSVTIAVAEGSVQVAPPSLAAGEVEEDEALTAIMSLMPLVSAKEEIVLQPESLRAAEADLVDWKNTPERTSDTVVLEQLTEKIRTSLTRAPKPIVITEESTSEILNSLPVVLSVPEVDSKDDLPAPELVSLTVTAGPSDSRIIINGQPAGRGVSSRVFNKGTSVAIQVISSDNRTIERTVIAGDEAVVNLIFPEIEPEETNSEESISEDPPTEADDIPVVIESRTAVEIPVVEFGIRVQPSDARIIVNGNETGIGRASVRTESGKLIRLRVLRPGFESYSRDFEAATGMPAMNIELEPRLLVRESPLPGAGIGTPASSNGYVVGATRKGVLFALNQNGERIWTLPTANRDGENTSPVISGNRVYSIGNSELVIVDLPSGNPVNRVELTGDRSDRFGRRPVPADNYLILPTDTSLEFLNPESGEFLKSVEIPQGSQMTPAIWNRQIITADQRGNLLYIDPDGPEIARKVGTDISQPTAQAPAISRNGIAVLSGRRGTVAAVNLSAGKVIWQRPLSDSGPVRVYTDIIISGNIAYVYGNETLYALNLDNGGDVFPPISGVSAPPLVKGDLLMLCYSGGLLVFHNRISGEFLGEVVLHEKASARPVEIGPYVVVAGETSAFVIDPRSIPGS